MTAHTTIRTGDLIDLFDEGGLVSAVVIGTEKGRLKVVTESGKEMRVTSSRVAHRVGSSPVSSAPHAAAAASRHSMAAAARLPEIDLAALWDVLVDEPQRCTLGSLASLGLGVDDAVARSAMLRALQDDRIYFARKQDLFEPRPREHVEGTIRRDLAERARAERRAAFVERARAAMQAAALEQGPPQPPPVEEHRDQIADLVELALVGDEAESRKEATALLDEAGVGGGSAAERAFRLLRAMGLFHRDENLFIHRFQLRTSFPAEVRQSAETAAARSVPVEGRRDLRHLVAFTIDDDLTTEMDDALSVETVGSKLVLGIHIADPDCFVPAGDPVDLEAMSRAATFYFPEVKLPMMPAAVAERAASLVVSEDRPALSFLVTMSSLGEVLSTEIVSSFIRSRARLTYEQADALLDDPEGQSGDPGEIASALSRLRPICELLEADRVAAGAVIIRAAEVDIRVNLPAEILIRRIDERGLSRRMVSEAMILANRLAADFCAKRGIPVIYRKQAPPQEAAFAPVAAPEPGALGAGAAGETDGYDPVAVRALRRRMRRGETSLTPAPHHGLGLPAYTQATSPIRRYQDLVVHRQIKAALLDLPLPYDAEAMARIAATTEEAERAAREAERGTDEYWILRHYEGRIGQEVTGVVVAADARRTEVELTDTLFNLHLAPRPDHSPGRRLRLLIESSNPRAGRLVVREMEP